MDGYRLGVRDQAITVALSTWFVIGIYLDGWAHNKLLIGDEGFFTPWHAVLYSGFIGSALWIASRVAQSKGERISSESSAYRLGLAGAVVFAGGGVSDMVWHSFMGVEGGFEALMSPPHLVMLVGALLILSTPVRHSWHSVGETPAFVELFPAVLSTSLVTAAIAFFHFYVFTWVNEDVWTSSTDGLAGEPLSVLAVAGLLITTAIVIAPVLVLANRWRLPFGAVGFMTVILAILCSSLTGFDEQSGLGPALVGGLVGDVVIRRWDPRRRPGSVILSVALPAALWISYFMLLSARNGIERPDAIWTGAIVLACLEGFAIGAMTSTANR